MEYLAPEVILDLEYGKEIDWWALGVMLYQFLCGFLPFQGKDDPQECYQQILYSKLKFPRGKVSNSAKVFVDRLLCKDPSKRLGSAESGGFKALLSQDWLTGMDWSNLVRKGLPSPWEPELEHDFDVSNFNVEHLDSEQLDRIKSLDTTSNLSNNTTKCIFHEF